MEPKKRGNPRGHKPSDEEIARMRDLGYVTVAEAAKAVGRAASSVYMRVGPTGSGLPRVRPDRDPVVHTPSRHVWIYLDSLKTLYRDPADIAQGKA